jgi:acyl-CoA reductase-like NAD-dependent aldehyde dehydrogenase
VTSAESADDRRIEVRCPGDGRVVATVPGHRPDDVSAMAGRLRDAQPAWEDMGPAGRAQVLRQLLDWLLDNQNRLTALIQDETGKSWGDAALEVGAGTDLINYYAGHAKEFLADREVRPWGAAGITRRLKVVHRPYQLVGVITPWNGPLGGPMLDGIPALAAGAAVLFKPSEVTPLTWREVTRAWVEDLGAPPVVANAVGGRDVGERVVDVVDMVMFTGSTATGRQIAARAGSRLIPCSLELGGKDAMVVLADADVERAASSAVWGSMMNSGQICISVERVYVEDAVYDRFVNLVVEKVKALRQGMDEAGSFATDIGAMITADQLEIVERHVADAIARGARVLTGGHRGAGQFYEPTVLVDVDHTMLCMTEETFGPTMPIMRVPDAATAVRLANDSDYGLSASVWSGDPAAAMLLARRLDAGAVNINNALISTFQLPVPMSGWKDSGVGSRAGGAAGVLKYCRPTSIVSDRVTLPAEPYWYPYRPWASRLQLRAIRLIGAHDWRRRLGLRLRRSPTSRAGR